MFNSIVLGPHVASPTRFASASLHVGAGVLLVPPGPLALLLGLVEAPAVVVELAQHPVTQLHVRPEATMFRFHQISILNIIDPTFDIPFTHQHEMNIFAVGTFPRCILVQILDTF